MNVKKVEIVVDANKLNVSLQKVVTERSEIKQYAYILHDKDNVLAHYHILLGFGIVGVDTKRIAKWFGVSENSICKFRGCWHDAFLYLTHRNECQMHKYQYSISDVITNLN